MTLDSRRLRNLHPHHPHTGNASNGTLCHRIGSRDQEGHVFGIFYSSYMQCCRQWHEKNHILQVLLPTLVPSWKTALYKEANHVFKECMGTMRKCPTPAQNMTEHTSQDSNFLVCSGWISLQCQPLPSFLVSRLTLLIRGIVELCVCEAKDFPVPFNLVSKQPPSWCHVGGGVSPRSSPCMSSLALQFNSATLEHSGASCVHGCAKRHEEASSSDIAHMVCTYPTATALPSHCSREWQTPNTLSSCDWGFC